MDLDCSTSSTSIVDASTAAVPPLRRNQQDLTASSRSDFSLSSFSPRDPSRDPVRPQTNLTARSLLSPISNFLSPAGLSPSSCSRRPATRSRFLGLSVPSPSLLPSFSPSPFAAQLKNPPQPRKSPAFTASHFARQHS
jgi:hypothetical protein